MLLPDSYLNLRAIYNIRGEISALLKVKMIR